MSEIFKMFWHGEKLSPLEWTCMRSFVDNGHSLQVFTYREITLPEGVTREDAGRIISSDQLFYFDDSPSAFSNIFRYKLLLEHGGWWVDTDVFCLSETLPQCKFAWAEEDPGQVNGAILKFPEADPTCREILRAAIDRARHLTAWGQLGPDLLTETLKNKNSEPVDHFGNQKHFYPIHWLQPHYFWLPEFCDLVIRNSDNALFIHFWNNMLKRMGVDVFRRPPSGSFLSRVYQGCPGILPSTMQDELASRETINSYLQQTWVRDWWVGHLGRDLAEIIPGPVQSSIEPIRSPPAGHWALVIQRAKAALSTVAIRRRG
jgi:Alpha 1,4-glycosyltransferase conserved region/Glycosyltransferase sugar-binding region containing DXD motif